MLTATKSSRINISEEIKTKSIAEIFSNNIKVGDTIFLRGELGVGKTTFIRYLINFLQRQNKQSITEISSPTFNLVHEYQLGSLVIKHYDLYRINDEKEFGVTVHYIDEGIDTGDIILQNKSLITDDDSYKTLLERAIDLCDKTLYEAIVKILNGENQRIKQKEIDPVGSYFRIRKEGDEWINWEWTSRKIFNFIRAITDPGPCAQTMFKENLIKIRNSKEIPNSPKYVCVPGEIVAKTDDSLILKTGDSTLSINSYDSLDKKNDMALRALRIGNRLYKPNH